MPTVQRLPVIVLALCAAAVAHQLLVATDVLHLQANGDSPFDLVVAAGFVALLVGGGYLIAGMFLARSDLAGSWPVVLTVPAAAALFVATLYSYDPYYGSNFRRYSDYHHTAPWVAALIAGALVVAAIGRYGERLALLLVGLSTWFCLFLVISLGLGH